MTIGRTDGQTAFQLNIVDYMCCYVVLSNHVICNYYFNSPLFNPGTMQLSVKVPYACVQYCLMLYHYTK